MEFCQFSLSPHVIVLTEGSTYSSDTLLALILVLNGGGGGEDKNVISKKKIVKKIEKTYLILF